MFAFLFAVVFFTALPLTSLAGLTKNKKTIFSLCCPQDQIFINNPEYYENDDEEYEDYEDYDDDEYPDYEPSTEKKENKPIICGQSEAKLNFSKIKIWDSLNKRLDIIF